MGLAASSFISSNWTLWRARFRHVNDDGFPANIGVSVGFPPVANPSAPLKSQRFVLGKEDGRNMAESPKQG
jgi:hypothetical protein